VGYLITALLQIFDRVSVKEFFLIDQSLWKRWTKVRWHLFMDRGVDIAVLASLEADNSVTHYYGCAVAATVVDTHHSETVAA